MKIPDDIRVPSGLTIGSTAMWMWYGSNAPRPMGDWDIWSPDRDLVMEQYTNSSHMRSRQRPDVFWDERLRPYIHTPYGFATPNQMYTIKVSHAPWEQDNGSWRKHMSDIVWLKSRGAVIDQEMHDVLYGIWEDLHGKKRVNLNQESGMFFTDAVTRVYDHDSIHDTVAHNDRPLWMEVLKDGQDVAMDMDKVWALPFGDRIDLFREEIYATALERWMIPNDYRFSPRVAYQWALRKTITSLTKGRSAQFMIENYGIFRNMPTTVGGNAWYTVAHELNREKLRRL